MEFTRLAIIYIHLIACCIAIGMVLTSDFAMVKQLLAGKSSSLDDNHDMSSLQKIVSNALLALWVTGIAVVALDASTKGWSYFENPKIQAKIGLVVLLTLNGIVLHKVVLPWMVSAGSLLKLKLEQRMRAIFAGTVSLVTWLYAALMGVGRPLSWKYSLAELLVAYPVLILGGFFTMLALTSWSKLITSKSDLFTREHQYQAMPA